MLLGAFPPSQPARAPQGQEPQRSVGQHHDVLALLISPLLSQAGRDVPCIVPSRSPVELLCAPKAPQAGWDHPSLGTFPGDTPGGSALFPSGSSFGFMAFFGGWKQRTLRLSGEIWVPAVRLAQPGLRRQGPGSASPAGFCQRLLGAGVPGRFQTEL